jgi:DNA-binding MarR family transcriptional regulator
MSRNIPAPPEAAVAQTYPMARFDMMTRLNRRNAELTYGDKFGMTLRECFCLSLIASVDKLPFKQFCTEAGLDKAQGSRTASRLIELGYAERAPMAKDLRSFDLVATAAGRTTAQSYLDQATTRNQQLLSVLSRGQREMFMEAVELIIATALEMNVALATEQKP